MNKLKKYVEKNPGLMKTFIAKQLGISKQHLNYSLKCEKLSKDMEEKVKKLK